jgi:hypothetical protein
MKLLAGIVAGLSMSSIALGANCPSEIDSKAEFNRTWPYNAGFGNDDANATVNAEVTIIARCDLAFLDAQANASVSAFNADIKLANAGVNAFWKQGASQFSGQMLVVGYELFNKDFSANDPVDLDFAPRYEIDETGTYTINVGPVAIPVEFGVTGYAGLDGKVDLNSGSVSGSLAPTAKAMAYVQALADAGVVEASIQGSALLLDNAFSADGAVSLSEKDQAVLVNYNADVSNNIEALNGQINAKVVVTEDDNALFERELFSWEGYARRDDVVSISDIVKL